MQRSEKLEVRNGQLVAWCRMKLAKTLIFEAQGKLKDIHYDDKRKQIQRQYRG